eukprot:56902-Pyramimonas_sp.AAC.1
MRTSAVQAPGRTASPEKRKRLESGWPEPTLESRNVAVTDRAVTSKSPENSPHGPSTHGLGTSDAPVARD